MNNDMTKETESEETNSSHNMVFRIENDHVAFRLDKTLVELCDGLSRSRLQSLIENGHVMVNDKKILSSSRKLEENDVVKITVPALTSAIPQAENIPLDIMFEDADMLVINKPAGMVVHPGAGNYTGTLVNALLAHCGATLSGIGGVARPGIVHRLDKETSGLMVVAKSDRAHKGLAAQLESRTLSRIYKALVFKVPFPPKGIIDQPLGRHAQNRLKIAIDRRNGRSARTHYHVQNIWGKTAALVECKLETGRTHQIRVHMESLGHPIIGDRLYGPQPNALKSMLTKDGYDEEATAEIMNFSRQALHAFAISYLHPVTEEHMSFEKDVPKDFNNLLKYFDK